METRSDYDHVRYGRQMLLTGWGEEGQARLNASSVFIAGAGGLGSPVSLYLAAAGVGQIRICDADEVELSNLNRQILHADRNIGELKAESARTTLEALNPTINILAYPDFLDEANVGRIVGQPDIIVDCLDNFETRYLLNAYCLQHKIPLVHGAIWGLTGQVTFIEPPHTPCLKCLFPEPPAPETFPVVGVTPGLVGCIQATEVLKYLVDLGTNLRGRLLMIDGEEIEFTIIDVDKMPACPVCG